MGQEPARIDIKDEHEVERYKKLRVRAGEA